MANWRDFLKKAKYRTVDPSKSQGTALDYDKNGVPVLGLQASQSGVDARRSVLRPRVTGPVRNPSAPSAGILQQHGNGNPDHMLGTMMNPILIAPSVVTGGVPRSALAAVGQGISAIGEEPAIAIIRGMVADQLIKRRE